MTKVTIDKFALYNVAINKAYGGMVRAVGYLQAMIDDAIRQRGTGRAYKRGNRTHIASAAGQPPATDTGRLRQSLASNTRKTQKDVIGTVSANTEYAHALEIGTSKMAARPYLRSTLEKNKKIIAGFFK